MSQKTPEKNLIQESNELTKQKEHENISKKTLLLKKSIQRVEDQGKRGKIKSAKFRWLFSPCFILYNPRSPYFHKKIIYDSFFRHK